MKLQFLDIRHQTAKDNDFWERRNKWGERSDCLSLLPRKSFQDTVQGGDEPGSTGAKIPRVSRAEYQTSIRESSRDLRVSSVSPQLGTWQCTHIRKLPEARERIRGIILVDRAMLELVPVPASQIGKTNVSWCTG